MTMRHGWLQKQNSNGLFFKRWKKRYFRLTDKALMYAKSMTSLNLCEEVNLLSDDSRNSGFYTMALTCENLCEVSLHNIKSVEKTDGLGWDWCFTVTTNLLTEDDERRVYVLQVLGDPSCGR
jgi:hypothetical protein